MKFSGGIWLALILCIAGVAQAAPRNKALAREAFEEGMRHYNLSEFKPALDSFKEAYRQYPDSSLLFNIGQCQRQLGDKQAAVLSFKAYLRESRNAPNQADVQALVSTLEESIRQDEQVKNRPPQEPMGASVSVDHPEPPPAPPAAAVATPAPPAATLVVQPEPVPTKPKKRAWIWGVVAGAVAAAGLAVGLGVGLSSHDPGVTLGSVRGN